MRYDKLVRDRIPEIIKEKGGKFTSHIANEQEYWQKLKEKLQEEVDEFKQGENREEVADILEVLEAICDFKGWDKSELQILKDKKAESRGGFKERIILEES
ncbi:MAG: nucleoside triphosphate pyrophosphohydrolase [Patescibacteria group bacterium]|jgi:predicted house-cleaning noncanonical NTP pyrophosphatase (MazG superfamily)